MTAEGVTIYVQVACGARRLRRAVIRTQAGPCSHDIFIT